jgi:hypothetical protein
MLSKSRLARTTTHTQACRAELSGSQAEWSSDANVILCMEAGHAHKDVLGIMSARAGTGAAARPLLQFDEEALALHTLVRRSEALDEIYSTQIFIA